MKYCLHYNQIIEYLKKADEIKVEFNDKKYIPDIFEKYPDKTVILNQTPFTQLDLEECKNFNILGKDRFIICLSNLDYVQFCKDNNIKFYYGYPISTFYQLEALKELGVCYIRLDAPIFFDLEKIKEYNIPIRAVPNVSYVDGIKRADGVCGTWIRPEDTEAYENYISVYEFEDCDERKEQALYRVYAIDKSWPSTLGTLITNLNHIGVNSCINQETSLMRMNCGQRCKRDNTCHICYRMLDLANVDKLREYEKAVNS